MPKGIIITENVYSPSKHGIDTNKQYKSNQIKSNRIKSKQ